VHRNAQYRLMLGSVRWIGRTGTGIATPLRGTNDIMLRITRQVANGEYVMKLEGCLAGLWVPELAACWYDAAALQQNVRIRVDLTDVCHVDGAGRELMTLMYRAGVRFVAKGFVMPELVREIAETVDPGQRS
jgi:ABC-type transporter Mla MlaB component